MLKDNPAIEHLRTQIEKTLGWGPSAAWTEQDFEELSERMDTKTQVRLSVSTLKRIWGRVRYESSPNIATLNTLAKFLDFSNWRDFLKKNAIDLAFNKIPDSGPTVQNKPYPNWSRITGPVKRMVLPTQLILALLLVSMGLISLLGNRKDTVASGKNFPVKFESRKVTEGLPNSVVFDYDASAYHSDKVYIQQNWDTTRREKVPGEGRQHTSVYYYPGYFRAKLVVDGQVKKESDVFIQSKGWLGIIGEKPVPIYLSPAEVQGQVALGVSAQILTQKTGFTVFNDRWVYFTTVREFKGLDPAHFNMTINLRNASTVEQSLCRKVKIYILGTESAIIIPLSDKGCIAELDLLTADRVIQGKENDLSAFGCDFSNFQQLSCTVENHRLKVSLNSRTILDEDQEQTIGNIIGLRIGFEGAGEIKQAQLSSYGKIIYNERFGK